MKKLTLSLALILSALSSASFAAVPTVPNTFVAGAVASASKVNENFASIADAISTEVTARITDSVAFQASIDAQSLKLTNLEKQGQTAAIDCAADPVALKTAYNDGYSGVNILAGSCEADFLINGRNFDITSDGLSSQTLLTQGTYEFDLALIASTVNITNVDVIGRIVVVRNSLMLFTDSDLDCSAYKGLRPGFVAQNSEIQLINANVSGCTSVALKYDSTLRLRGKTSVSGGTYGNAITAENNSNIIANDDASDILVYMDNSDLVAPDTFKESIWLSGSSLQLSDSGLTLAGSIYGADSHLEISNITWLAAGDNVQKFIRAHLNSHLDLRNLDPTNSEINVSLSSTLIMSGMEDFQISDLDIGLSAGSAGVILTPLFTEAASPASNGLWLGEGSNLNMFVNDTLYPSYEFDFDFAASSGSEFRLSGGTIANPDPCGGGGLYYVNGAALCGSLATTADLLSGDTGYTSVDCSVNTEALNIAMAAGYTDIYIDAGICNANIHVGHSRVLSIWGIGVGTGIVSVDPIEVKGGVLRLYSLTIDGRLYNENYGLIAVDDSQIDCSKYPGDIAVFAFDSATATVANSEIIGCRAFVASFNSAIATLDSNFSGPTSMPSFIVEGNSSFHAMNSTFLRVDDGSNSWVSIDIADNSHVKLDGSTISGFVKVDNGSNLKFQDSIWNVDTYQGKRLEVRGNATALIGEVNVSNAQLIAGTGSHIGLFGIDGVTQNAVKIDVLGNSTFNVFGPFPATASSLGLWTGSHAAIHADAPTNVDLVTTLGGFATISHSNVTMDIRCWDPAIALKLIGAGWLCPQ